MNKEVKYIEIESQKVSIKSRPLIDKRFSKKIKFKNIENLNNFMNESIILKNVFFIKLLKKV